ncbi:RNA cytidine acetyltransferase 1 [Tanacetum coccineum]
MVRKKVDERVRTLIRNGVEDSHRSFFVIVGDKSRDQIVSLHYMLRMESIDNMSRPKNSNVLWCYRNKLELSSHKKKQAKQMKRINLGRVEDPDKLDEFSLFLQTTKITYCKYKDSEKILGNTYGMCILQDFEALTPNLLARTIETVQGGGLVIMLIRSLSSLTSLYTMVMVRVLYSVCITLTFTCESEYIAACEASKEAIWMKNFIGDLGVVPTVQDPIEIFCDNESAIALTKEPKDHGKSKHIERKYHFVRSKVEEGHVIVKHIRSEDNPADPFTKALAKSIHDEHARSIGLKDNIKF